MKKFIAEMRVYKQALAYNKENKTDLKARIVYCHSKQHWLCQMGLTNAPYCIYCQVIIQNF